MNDNWLLNLNARYIGMESKAKLDGASLGKAKIDPCVHGANVDIRF